MINENTCSDSIIGRGKISHAGFRWAQGYEPGVGIGCVARLAGSEGLRGDFKGIYGNGEPMDALIGRIALC